MAITVTAAGNNSRTTSSTTMTITPGFNYAASSWAVLSVSVDNSNTNGAAHSTFTVTDTKSNTWTRRVSPLMDPGLANAGVEGAMFTTAQDGGALTTGDTITITVGTAATAWAADTYEVTTTGTLSYVNGNVNAGATTTTPTVTTASITSGNVVIGGFFVEQGQPSITGDSDTTNGTWVGINKVQNGTVGNTGIAMYGEYKITTGTGTQTWNLTVTNSDNIMGWIELAETANNVTVTPSTASLTLTTFAPTVTATAGVTVTPTTASLTTATFAPTVTATANVLVTPTTATLNLTTFAPTVTATGAFAQGVGGFMVIG